MKRFFSRTVIITALTLGGLVSSVALPASGSPVTAGGDRNWCC